MDVLDKHTNGVSALNLLYKGTTEGFDYSRFMQVLKDINSECLVIVQTTTGATSLGFSNVGLTGPQGYTRDVGAKLVSIDRDYAVSPRDPNRALKFAPEFAFSFGG